MDPFSTPSKPQVAAEPVTLQPSVLVPAVKITPECRVLIEGKNDFWVAIELSTKLSTSSSSHVSKMQNPLLGQGTEGQPWNISTDLNAHGYLYDFHVEIRSTPHSRINEVLGYETTPIIFLSGSKSLILANIGLPPNQDSRAKQHVRQRSDDLIEDLEIQLGSIETEYMEVRLTYGHSAFPRMSSRDELSQIASVKTSLETTVSAVIKQHNNSSPWSPPPAPTPNRMFDIVASHWGRSAVDDLVRKPIVHQPTYRKAATLACRSPAAAKRLAGSCSVSTLKSGAPSIGAPSIGAPSIPSRRTSLRQSSLEKRLDPARKIWAEMRRTSSSSRSHRKSSSATCPIPSETAGTPLCLPSKSSCGEVDRRRQTLRETALRNQRSVGADTLRSLVPTVSNLSIDEKPAHKYHFESGKENKALDTKSKKDSGRWSWTSWW